MKRTICALSVFVSTLGVTTIGSASMSYECWSYSGGVLGKMVHVTAGDRVEAARLAADKFRGLSVPFDDINCK